MSVLTIIIAGFGMWLLIETLKKKNLHHIPDTSDDDFIKMFEKNFSMVPTDMVIHERKNIAKFFGIPSLKLTPSQTFDDLSKYLNYFGSYDLALGDIEDEVSELFEHADIKKPYHSVSTIGELIHKIIKAKMKLTYRKSE